MNHQTVIEQLNNWYTGGSNMPLVVRGARGVGKTFTVLNFAAGCDRPYLYVNFENDAVARDVFGDVNKPLETAIATYFGIEQEAIGRFLLIFDEHQACNRDLTRSEGLISAFGVKIIYLSSLDTKSDYGAFTGIMMTPSGFRDFLDMTGKEWYREVIEAHYAKEKPVPTLVHQEIIDLYYEYLRVGGMPGVINVYNESESEIDVLDAQMRNLNLIRQDIRNYGGANGNVMCQILDSIPAHIGAGKPHYMPGLIRRGLTVANISEGIDELINNGIVYRTYRANVDENEFRLGVNDCGILHAMLASRSTLRGDKMDRALSESATGAGLCGNYDVKYLRLNGSALNAMMFESKEGEKIAADISGTYLRHSTVSAAFESMADRPKIIRLGDVNFQSSLEELILSSYVYELL